MYGKLALAQFQTEHPLQILESAAGFYIGTFDELGPLTRESEEYFPTAETAAKALETHSWTQRHESLS